MAWQTKKVGKIEMCTVPYKNPSISLLLSVRNYF